MLSPGNSKLQLDCTNPTHKEQTMNCEDKVSRKVVCSNTFDALMINSDQELHALSTPILQISNPETTRIIKESHATMLDKENPMVKPSMATINTSNHDVPNSPSLELRAWRENIWTTGQSPKGMTRVWGRKQVILDGQIWLRKKNIFLHLQGVS
ncbi:hypothetical protein R3W88_005744 [Solanum pinnatisectum]|uniref:Uncharacterized protein n=1 Tax=Solanum pinnatisectum TaxID=50273 RepID=A0AAV9KDA7_9SOLN|nr:hypothetical protein R3W88_005744 [Solanum pinnatisectum]